MALSDNGSTLAVGAIGEASNATDVGGNQDDNSFPLNGAGAVYVFVRIGGDWSQQAYIKASNTGDGDIFGSSVALSDDGNTLAVGANGEDSETTGIDGDENEDSFLHFNAGAVYVFVRTGVDWSQQAYIKASNTDELDFFGWTVALSDDGNTLAVGATQEDSNATGIGGDQENNLESNAGAIYVFVRTGEDWSPQAYVKAPFPGAYQLGDNIALSGDGKTLVAGSEWEDSGATGIGGNQFDDSNPYSGVVYLY